MKIVKIKVESQYGRQESRKIPKFVQTTRKNPERSRKILKKSAKSQKPSPIIAKNPEIGSNSLKNPSKMPKNPEWSWKSLKNPEKSWKILKNTPRMIESMIATVSQIGIWKVDFSGDNLKDRMTRDGIEFIGRRIDVTTLLRRIFKQRIGRTWVAASNAFRRWQFQMLIKIKLNSIKSNSINCHWRRWRHLPALQNPENFSKKKMATSFAYSVEVAATIDGSTGGGGGGHQST